MNFGISTATLYPMLTEDALRWMIENQVEVTEIFFNSFCELEPSYGRMLRDMVKGSGTRVAAVHPCTSMLEPFMFFTAYERRLDDILDFYKRYFEIMNMLECPLLVFHGDLEGSRYSDALYFERFARLREAGKTFGVTVAQENVARCKSGGMAFIKKMKEHFGDDMAFVLDIKQALRRQTSPFAMMEAMGNSLVHCHVSDNCAEADCLPPGRGDFDFGGFAGALRRQGFDGSMMIELYRQNYVETSEVLDALSYLREAAR